MAEQVLTLKDNVLAVKELTNFVQTVLDSGVSSLRMQGNILFDGGASGSGCIGYDTSTSKMMYSNDGGASWQPLAATSYEWSSMTPYTSGSVVLHNQGWYECVSVTSGTEPGLSDKWRLLTLGTAVKYASNKDQLKAALDEILKLNPKPGDSST